MRRPLRGSLRRAITGGGRWTGPGRWAAGGLALVALTLAATAAGVLVWATKSASPDRTLALAAGVLRETPALDSALDVAWTWSVGGAGSLEDRWLGLVAPTLPPGVCLPSRGGEGALDTGLNAALRQLDRAVTRGARPEEMERRLQALRDAGSAVPGSRPAFLVRYNLARGHGAAGDWPAAAEVLEPVLSAWIGTERVPEADRRGAEERVAAGRVDESLALDAIHGRYLAATIAYRRGEARRAVTLFRRTLNAFHYLLATRRGERVEAGGHEQRVVAPLGASACAGGGARDALTSLDAYAGLVAAYMADEGFRDPAGLPAEVARTRLEIDPGDPLAPVLELARRSRGDPRRTPVPENLLWAASNLQRVYHANRLRPEPRLDVTRAVLLLHLTGDETWAAALRDVGDADVCAMLAGLVEDLRGRTGAGTADRAPAPADSVRAAVAVQAFARLQRECRDGAAPPVEAEVRSGWIRLGGSWLTRGVGGRYEAARVRIGEVLGAAGAPVQVLEDRLGPEMAWIRAQRSALRRGRVPPELAADLPVKRVGRFVEEWWRAFWLDVAGSLAVRVRGPDDAGPAVRAGEVPALLTALESAVAHAGRRPVDVYRVGETAPLAATGGAGAELAWRVRTVIRNHPFPAAAVLGGMALALGVAALLAHVSAWRYRLLVRRRFYREESAGVAGAAGRAA